ncbi:MAG: hypothetical protein AAB352_02025 [Patescibacteria group bacterium]
MNWDCISNCLSIIGLLAIVFIIIYFILNQKCPNCRKRGGICVYDKRGNNGSNRKVYDVLYCGKCGYVISETPIGEMKEI